MGNQLVGIAPSQIFPVEHYLTEVHDIQFDVNLGSTRFLKVARAGSQEGLIVVKVFAIHDPTLPLSEYKIKVDGIKKKLASAVNCLPFQKTLLTDKAGFLMREYVKYSLYDRMSTRPFLTAIEKKWIAFQVLYALHQCHKLGVCHGDIKLENIMITSWNWVLLTDFASYKPTYLPEDNPADFSYFFDTSRRRTCYIAPERFIKTLNNDVSSQLLLPEDNIKSGDLAPSMDIFSVGCALTELFNEGHPPFDFSQLLAYHSGEYSTSKILDRVEDPDIRELLRNMMAKDPSVRASAEVILAQHRGGIFPEFFYIFLQSYMLIFSTSPILSPDEKIFRLSKDIKNIIKIMKPATEVSDTGNMKASCVNEGLVIITSLITSCVRGLHHCSSKLQCLETMLEVAVNTSSETILDRILPYIFHLVKDSEPRVRVTAIHTLSKCLAAVKNVPSSDANIFPEYVLPTLATVCQDEAVLVRVAYAETIADLAETALRFLEQSQQELSQNATEGQNCLSFEYELNILTEMIQQMVSLLLKDPDNLVRQTLLESGITRLCVFFGKQRAHEVLLSHMITFLNDKEDKMLRGTFYDSIVGVAAYVGCHGTTALLPLLQQGLSDAEEFVIVKAINAITALTELGLITKLTLYDMLHDIVCFLVHPNLWIRHAVVRFISTLSRTLDPIDIQCKVLGMIQPYLKTPLIQVNKEFLLLSALKPSMPRAVYDIVVKSSDIKSVLQTIEERQQDKEKQKEGHLTSFEIPHSLQSVFRRLSSEGMDCEVENQILAMGEYLQKIHTYQCALTDTREASLSTNGQIDLAHMNIPSHSVRLNIVDHKGDLMALSSYKFQSKKLPSEAHAPVMNEEWQHMFGALDVSSGSDGKTASESGRVSPSGETTVSVLSDSVQVVVPQRNLEVDHVNMSEKSSVQYRCAPCKSELCDLMARKQEQYAKAVRSLGAGEWHYDPAVTWEMRQIPPPGWRLRGMLVAHLHEHRGAVNGIVAVPKSPLFASCSSDGYIRVWDCEKMEEGRNVANRSCQVYNHMGGALYGVTSCDHGKSLASASQNGSVFVTRLDGGSSKMTVLQQRKLDLQEEGSAVDISAYNSVVVYATLYGSVVGWDLRSPSVAWKLDNDLKQGVITTFCLDNRQSWLTLGTSSGNMICWDLRFQLPVTCISHPNNCRLRRLVKHPTEQSWVIASSQGHNEVTVWNLETNSRQVVLWASNAPPLSKSVSSHSVCGMCTGLADRGAPFLLTGGSDMRVRFWDLESLTDSYIAVPAANDPVPPNASMVLYKTRLVDGTSVVQEVCLKVDRHGRGLHFDRTGVMGPGIPAGLSASADIDCPRAGPDQPSVGHHDWISEVALCQATQCFMLTGSRDGVIKVWK